MKLLSFLKTHLKKPSCLLGLEVSDTSLNLVELSYSFIYTLNSAVQVPLISGKEHLSWEHPAFPAFLKQTLEQSGIKTRQVAFSLPHFAVLFKNLELDKKLSMREMSIQVHTHAERYFNYPISELMIDFERVGESKKNPDLYEMRWVAAKKSEVLPKIEVLKTAGLIPTILEVDSFALQRLACFFIKAHYSESKSAAVIHFYNQDSFLLQVLEDGKSLYVRTEMKNHSIVQTLRSILNNTISQLSLNLHLIIVSGNILSDSILGEISEQTGIQTIFLDSYNLPGSQFCVSYGLAMRACHEH